VMIERYTLPEMASVWGDENRFRIWLEIEILACEAWSELGVVPKEAVAVIREKAGFDMEEIRRFEEANQHEMIAFLESVQKRVGPESRHIHSGLTSSDVMDTATAVQIKQAGELVRKELDAAIAAVRERAERHRGVFCVARTHGIHAEPTTLGL